MRYASVHAELTGAKIATMPYQPWRPDGYEGDPFPYPGNDPEVPKGFEMNPEEENCYGHSERLNDANPNLRFNQGWTRLHPEAEWGWHQWNETPEGRIVDPYAEIEWPNYQLEYRPAPPEEDPNR